MQQIDLYEILESPKSAGRNQLVSNCPFCEKSGHFYINKQSLLWDCKKCGEAGNISKLLKKLGRFDLTSTIENIEELNPNILEIHQHEHTDTQCNHDIKYPIGFKRSFNNPYLIGRGFTESDFYKYEVGTAPINPKYNNYVIIGVYQDGQLLGYISRHVWEKSRIKKFEQRTGNMVFRYKNSKGVQFSKLLFGYDEIVETTSTVILVEGFFKKLRVDNLLNLDDQSDIKCCATFGKKVSQQQIELLKRKGIQNVILAQDNDAVYESKRDSFVLQEHFQTLVGYVSDGALDDCSVSSFFDTFQSLETPEKYFFGKVALIQ